MAAVRAVKPDAKAFGAARPDVAPALPHVQQFFPAFSDTTTEYTAKDTLAELSMQDLQSIHLASVASTACWQYANALQESCFHAAEQEANKQIHALAGAVEAAYRAATAVKARQRSEHGKLLLQAALSAQVPYHCV